ncbi:MAG: hypothetical protein JXA79_03830, partial [Deltaproteobacteria bacterium]|nr:hypothetical protein [Deltaproteobacteria bacterium]
KADNLNLPRDVIEKLKGKDLELLEVREGFLLRPVDDPIKEARGFLRGKQFSTAKYFQMKKEDKDVEG